MISPTCDAIGYYQHYGECWSDSLQMVLLYCDGIKELSQPRLYNLTDADIKTIVNSYIDQPVKKGLFEEYYKLLRTRFRNHYDATAQFKQIAPHCSEKDARAIFNMYSRAYPILHEKTRQSAELGPKAALLGKIVSKDSPYNIARLMEIYKRGERIGGGTTIETLHNFTSFCKHIGLPYYSSMLKESNLYSPAFTVGALIMAGVDTIDTTQRKDLKRKYVFQTPNPSNAGHTMAILKCNNTLFLYNNNRGLITIAPSLLQEVGTIQVLWDPNAHRFYKTKKPIKTVVVGGNYRYIYEITHSMQASASTWTPIEGDIPESIVYPIEEVCYVNHIDALQEIQPSQYTRKYNELVSNPVFPYGAPVTKEALEPIAAVAAPAAAAAVAAAVAAVPAAVATPKAPLQNTRRKTRISTLAQCIRRTAATARIPTTRMPDSPRYTASAFDAMDTMSTKFSALIANIRKLDAKDMKTHNTLFKHFIFTDIRESAYGAKALASYLIAAGFDFRMNLEKKSIRRGGVLVETKTGETVLVHKPAVHSGSQSFALLQSLPLWKNPLSLPTKKDILQTYNKRPENSHGELLRIIVLDSKYKEGIDLFDVKYVHLLEPAIANSDLKQAIGRATRFCGQKGLQFLPRRGWPLEVFVYSTTLPNVDPYTFGTSPTLDAHELMLAKSGIDLALLNLTKEVTVLAVGSAVDYDLNFKINNFDMESALLDVTDVEDVLVAEVAPVEDHESRSMTGGGRGTLQRVVAVHSVADLTPELLTKCYRRQSRLFPFSKKRMEVIARRMGLSIPRRARRAWYCNQLQSSEGYFDALQKHETPRIQQSLIDISETEHNANNDAWMNIRDLLPTSSSPSSSSSSSPSPSSPSPSSPSPSSPSPASLFPPPPLAPPPSPAGSGIDFYDLPFAEFQNAVRKHYSKYAWKSPAIKDGCNTATAASAPGAPVTFTQTQDFIRKYLVPESPFKGLLAWHSVGTGKTCMAVAASSAFEKAGYTILWVTRNSLMSDVYKNIFGSVCSIPMMEYIASGGVLPTDPIQQKRLLSHGWMPPISYKTFQNALEKKNELGRLLYQRNRDPLRNTFLIMDEIHKLQDGDLGAAEAADFTVIQRYIHESYKLSGKKSVRPLLMTATPITDRPHELFEILNTLIPTPTARLMPFQTFRETYTTDTGTIAEEGKIYFKEHAKGLISYLNREFDPTTFAQPIVHTIHVPAVSIKTPTLDMLVDACLPGADTNILHPAVHANHECAQAAQDLEHEIAEVSASATTAAEKRKTISALKKTYKAKLQQCKRQASAAQKAFAKTRRSGLRTCYAKQKKMFVTQYTNSQLRAMESCFGKPKRPDFVSSAEFQNEMARRLTRKNRNSRGTANAVRTPIHSA